MDANICYCDRSLSSCIYCLIAKVNGSGCYGDNVVIRRICTIAAKYCREHCDSTCPLAQAQFHSRLLSRELSLETPGQLARNMMTALPAPPARRPCLIHPCWSVFPIVCQWCRSECFRSRQWKEKWKAGLKVSDLLTHTVSSAEQVHTR